MMEERNRHRFAREIKNCADRIAGADDAALPVYVHKLLSAILRMAEREGLAPGDMAVKNDTVTAVDTDISSLTSRAREYKAWYEAVSKPFEAMRREKEISGAVSDELSVTTGEAPSDMGRVVAVLEPQPVRISMAARLTAAARMEIFCMIVLLFAASRRVLPAVLSGRGMDKSAQKRAARIAPDRPSESFQKSA